VSHNARQQIAIFYEQRSGLFVKNIAADYPELAKALRWLTNGSGAKDVATAGKAAVLWYLPPDGLKGLTQAEYGVYHAFEEHGGYMNWWQVRDAVGGDQAFIKRTIARLEDMELIEKAYMKRKWRAL